MSNPFARFSFKDAEADLPGRSSPGLKRKRAGSDRKQKKRRSSGGDTRSPAEVCLKEYNLIAQYRKRSKATVDEFHNFLLSLRNDEKGRYWALVACLLSVQCRDKVSLEAIRSLIKACPNGAADVLKLTDEELVSHVKRCNFYRTKISNVRSVTSEVLHSLDGRVPSKYRDLLKLQGVGPKIAHVLRSVVFDNDYTGIVVDTHVHRVATLLGWVAGSNCPEETRRQLQEWVPIGGWTDFSTAVVGFGQLARTKDWSWGFLEGFTDEDSRRLAHSVVRRMTNT